MKKILSIAVPIYNIKKELVEKAIDSILEIQKNTDKVQGIIVDNGSTIPIFDHLKNKYKDTDLLFHRIEVNNGKPQSTLKALELSNSKWMLILDSDDWLDLEQTLDLLPKLQIDDSDIGFLNYTYYRQSKDSYRKRIVYKTKEEKVVFKKMPKFFWHFDNNVIYNVEFLRKNNFSYPKTVTTYEDVYNNMWSLSKASRITFFNNNIYYYRTNQGGENLSSSTVFMKKFDKFKDMVSEVLKFDYENEYTKSHTTYFVSLQLIAILFFGSMKENNIFPHRQWFRLRKELKENNYELFKRITSLNPKHFTLIGLILTAGTPAWWIAIKIVKKFRK